MKILVLVLTLSTFLLPCGEVAAEEAPIYESLSEVSIGRVFFSAAQRARLDRLRGTSGIG